MRRLIGLAVISSDVASVRRLRRLLGAGVTPRTAAEPVRLRSLGGRAVWIRPGTTDAAVLWDTFRGRYHLPQAGDSDAVRVIWDLGANIGLTAAHLATVFPRAQLLAVELDADNASLARRNLAPWADRCEVLEAAVWVDDGEVRYASTPHEEWGAHVVAADAGGGALATSRAVSLNTLLGRGPVPVDYVKMDIEGAEKPVLSSHTEWAAEVRQIKVEVHEPYSVQACRADLERLGFSTSVDNRHWACVVGTRSAVAATR